MKAYLNKIQAVIDMHTRGYSNDFELIGNDLLWIQQKIFIRENFSRAMAKRLPVKAQVAARVRERVYSPTDISHMFGGAGFPHVSEGRIREYALEHNLGVTPDELGILAPTPCERSACYVRSSYLGTIIDGLGIVSVTPEQLERAADLKYRR